MNLNQLLPQTPTDVADWSDVEELQRRMAGSVTAMAQMAGDVGLAKSVLEFSGDRRKRALARQMTAALAGGESAAKAEAEARASEIYGKELAQLQKEQGAAEQVVMEWEAAKLIWQTCQSLLAMQRESVKRL